MNRIVATYLMESPHPIERAAEVVAGEQSSGTFVQVHGETPELRQRTRATIERIEPLEPADAPSLGGSRPPRPAPAPLRYNRARVTFAFPFDNVGTNLPTLVATLLGNLFELAEVSGLKLLDFDLPGAFGRAYPGPQFGIAGTRRLCGVDGRPIIGTIIKPSVGLSPQQTAELVGQLGGAGIDFVKDDELMANPPHSPLRQRAGAVLRVINELADRTGKKVMYAINITDELEEMLRHHDHIQRAGGTCVMVSLNSIGLLSLAHLLRRCALPIHGHRNGWGMLTRHPMLGMEFTAYQKLWRLAGADHLHVNGLQNKFWEPDESVVRSIGAVLSPMFDHATPMPVVSSGQWGGQAPETYRRTGTVDLMYLAGGGIMAHPGGPAAGLRGIQQAWEAAVQGIDLATYASEHPELRQTMEKYGGR
jgi:ribulose-bisphosphate carboxylase large chain